MAAFDLTYPISEALIFAPLVLRPASKIILLFLSLALPVISHDFPGFSLLAEKIVIFFFLSIMLTSNVLPFKALEDAAIDWFVIWPSSFLMRAAAPAAASDLKAPISAAVKFFPLLVPRASNIALACLFSP